MKKLFTLLFAVLTASLIAQQWCPPGARWQYKSLGNVVGVDGKLEYNYVGDTVVNGKNCKKITGLFIGKKYPIWSHTIIPEFTTDYTYEDNGVVYLARGSTFDTVVNYNAKVGDAWRLRGSACPHINTWHVKDTSSLMINGKRLKVINAWAFPTTNWNGDTVTNQFVERLYHFASVSDFEFMRGKCYDGAAEFATTSFICYSDNEIGVYSPGSQNCMQLAGLRNVLEKEIEIFGSPGGTEVCVTVPSFGYDIKVFDLLGREVSAKKLSNGKNRVGLNTGPGVYLVSVYREGAQAKTAKVILGQ